LVPWSRNGFVTAQRSSGDAVRRPKIVAIMQHPGRDRGADSGIFLQVMPASPQSMPACAGTVILC